MVLPCCPAVLFQGFIYIKNNIWQGYRALLFLSVHQSVIFASTSKELGAWAGYMLQNDYFSKN
jgi:hypothetical protein